MKKELSPGMMAVIIIAAVALIGGLGFVFFNRATGNTPISREREEQEAKAAAEKYNQYTGGQNTPGATGGAAVGGPPGGEAEARAKMGGGASSGN